VCLHLRDSLRGTTNVGEKRPYTACDQSRYSLESFSSWPLMLSGTYCNGNLIVGYFWPQKRHSPIANVLLLAESLQDSRSSSMPSCCVVFSSRLCRPWCLNRLPRVPISEARLLQIEPINTGYRKMKNNPGTDASSPKSRLHRTLVCVQSKRST
jgi:hypothetical protein